MKKFFILCFFSTCFANAQQRVTISDSTMRVVIDSFIDELKLDERQYKIIRIELIDFSKPFVETSSDTVSVGSIKGRRIEGQEQLFYSFTVRYEVNSRTLEFDPATYYTIYRGIPVLFSTGLDHLVRSPRKMEKELKESMKKHSIPNSVSSGLLLWYVEVRNKKLNIKKVS